MTDLEISKALALAIGWTEAEIEIGEHSEQFIVRLQTHGFITWRIFDYRDWAVIGPIGGRYKAFPHRLETRGSWWVCDIDVNKRVNVEADTPQKAIAMAVIEGVRK